MKRIIDNSNPRKPVVINLSWSDHRVTCAKCMTVDLDRSATLALACAEGSPLAME